MNLSDLQNKDIINTVDGKKSVGIRSIDEGYYIIEIPSKKLRTYMNSDYSCLSKLEEGF